MSLRERLALPDPERPSGAETHDAPNQAYQELKFSVQIHQFGPRIVDIDQALIRGCIDDGDMTSILTKPTVIRVAILAAALELQRLHGTGFAAHFLGSYEFDATVIAELLSVSTNLLSEI